MTLRRRECKNKKSEVCVCDRGSLSCEKKSWGLSEDDESFEGGTSEKEIYIRFEIKVT